MSQPLDRSDADRNLLFGILALQVNFISRDALVAAMQAWVIDKKKSLGQILLEQKRLTDGQVQALEVLIVQHLQAHDGDPERSLQAVSVASAVRSTLLSIGDGDLQERLAEVCGASQVEDTGIFHPPSSDGARYRRLRDHAEGGLGKVFVAEDTELHREVALKEIRAEHADDPDSRGRFVREAEITGGLEHPGIVPVYGLGAYPNGRPYYAMRFIHGDSLKDAIERFHLADQKPRDPGERSLAFRHLLRRYVDICNAVAYAHSRGVLHRDLKPANVMLGKFGETLVVDWGLAKAGVKDQKSSDIQRPVTEERTLRPSSGSSADQTQAGVVLGTPSYMSPEQAAGKLLDLGPASDIYSLGTMLYVLLTGKKPYPAIEKGAIMAAVRRGEFAPPLEVKPDTPPALDAICRKAMALKPENRYATALDLAADVEHWLADEPVEAYPERWKARAGRWARRHRETVAGAAAFLVSAVIALSLSMVLVWVEQHKTAAQKKIAEDNLVLVRDEQKKTTAQKQIAEDNLVLVRDEQKKTAEQKQIAENSLVLVRDEQKKTAEQRETAAKHYLLARDVGFKSIDLIESTQVDLASNPAWHAKRKDILVTASRSSRRFLAQEPDDPELQTRAAQVFRFAANFHRLENDVAAAEPLFRDSIRLQEKLVEQFPEEAIRRDTLAATLRDEANILAGQGRLDKAAGNLERAIKIVEKLQKEDPEEPAYQRSFATAQLDLASIQYVRGKVSQSKTTAQSAADLFAKLLELSPENIHPYDPLLRAAALNRVAVVERDQDVKQALTTHNAAIKLLQGMVDKPSPNVVRADVLHHLARCRLEQARTMAKAPDKRAAAEKMLAATALQWQQLAKNYDKVPQYRSSRAYACLLLGQLRAEDQRGEEADADFKTARELLEPLVKEFPGTASYWGGLGKAYAGTARLARLNGEDKAAAQWFRKAEDALSKAVELSPADVRDLKALDEVRAERAK
jgi:tetratricopeptide (TPR) repeat protein/tRNA A-37 threonylcarbamoyl transferase component Bud32